MCVCMCERECVRLYVCRKDLKACIVTKEIFLNLKNSRETDKIYTGSQ